MGIVLTKEEEAFGSEYEDKCHVYMIMTHLTPALYGKIGNADFTPEARVKLKKWLDENKIRYDKLVLKKNEIKT